MIATATKTAERKVVLKGKGWVNAAREVLSNDSAKKRNEDYDPKEVIAKCKYQPGQRVRVYQTKFMRVEAPASDIIGDSYYEGIIQRVEHHIYEKCHCWYRIDELVIKNRRYPKSWKIGTEGDFYSDAEYVFVNTVKEKAQALPAEKIPARESRKRPVPIKDSPERSCCSCGDTKAKIWYFDYCQKCWAFKSFKEKPLSEKEYMQAAKLTCGDPGGACYSPAQKKKSICGRCGLIRQWYLSFNIEHPGIGFQAVVSNDSKRKSLAAPAPLERKVNEVHTARSPMAMMKLLEQDPGSVQTQLAFATEEIDRRNKLINGRGELIGERSILKIFEGIKKTLENGASLSAPPVARKFPLGQCLFGNPYDLASLVAFCDAQIALWKPEGSMESKEVLPYFTEIKRRLSDQNGNDLKENRFCACGCGGLVIGNAKKKWASDACKLNAWKKKHAAEVVDSS